MAEANLEKVSVEVQNYIEQEILPKYETLKGHTGEHIRQVIERSMKFAEQAPGLNLDMAYVIAAYHDLGRLVDDDTHNIESAKMLLADDFLKKRFSDDEMKTMAEAVEDHRASLGREPRSIYGKLVSSADRNPSVESMLERIYDFAKSHYPEMAEDDLIEMVRGWLRKKYAPDGYAAKVMYFDDPGYEAMLEKVGEITSTPDKFAKVMKGFNAQRFKKAAK